MSTKAEILKVLNEVYPKKLAVHEFPFAGFSQISIANRLRDLVREGKLVCEFREGKHFKEWGFRNEIKTEL